MADYEQRDSIAGSAPTDHDRSNFKTYALATVGERQSLGIRLRRIPELTPAIRFNGQLDQSPDLFIDLGLTVQDPLMELLRKAFQPSPFRTQLIGR